MNEEARMTTAGHGREPVGSGWFVVNVAEARWRHSDKFGWVTRFEGATPFPHLAINIRVLEPGQPNCHYHREDQQEAFLVLSGSCRLLVAGQERVLSQWDFFHCPPHTDHVVVGAGAGPCAILMVGRRDPNESVVYPVAELALKYGAGVKQETTSPAESYAGLPDRRDCPAPPPFV